MGFLRPGHRSIARTQEHDLLGISSAGRWVSGCAMLRSCVERGAEEGRRRRRRSEVEDEERRLCGYGRRGGCVARGGLEIQSLSGGWGLNVKLVREAN
eukprot:767051-Hanusia_phi.AAC.3